MNLRTLLLPLLLIVWLAPGHAPLHAEGGPPVAATYSNTVTEAELANWLQHVQRTNSTHREFDLQELILVKSLAAEATWLGLDRQVEVQIELELKEASLAQAALRSQVAASVTITEEEIEAKYQVFKDTFTQPRRVRLRNLFLRYPPAANSETKSIVRAELEEIRQRVENGQDFKRLATAHSDSQTRFRGGLIGNVRAGTLAPKIDAIAMAMQPGELSEILTGPDGLTLLFCEKILPKVVRSPEELREIAHQRLKNRTSRQRWEVLQEEWLEAAEAHYHWQILESEISLDKAVAVEFASGELSRRQLAALMSSPRPLSQIPRQQIRQRTEAYLIAKAALREVRRRGLEEFDGLERRQLWSRRKTLATRASLHLVEEDFKPPSEEEVRQYYRQNTDSFVRPPHFDLAAILLPPLGDDLLERFRQGELLVHRLERGEITFEEAARHHSRHPSVQAGGRLGWISRPALPRVYGLKVLQAILRLTAGNMSGLVQDGDNLWIFKLITFEEERPMTWEEAKEQASDLLGSERVRDVEARIRQERLEALGIEVISPPAPRTEGP
jgi:parvulin-like peptidyl-prolyl isomerase